MGQTNAEQTERLAYIDFLKFIGISCIILAHVQPPGWLMMIRNFDVPLMVIISSFLAKRSYDKVVAANNPTSTWLISRFTRLAFPTWIFLTLYFALYFVLSGKLASPWFYLASYALTTYGIAYVWVIPVYIYCAFFTPLFNKIGYSTKTVFSVILIYVLYEIAFFFRCGVDHKIILTTFYYAIPYGVVAFTGYNYSKMTTKHKYIILLISFASLVTSGLYYWIVYGSPQPVQIVKYPPRIYFLSFGILCSFALLLFCEKHFFRIYEHPIIKYISMHSMWIYLWHILALTAYEVLSPSSAWFIKYVAVYTFAILTTLIINKILNLIEKKRPCFLFKYLRG